MIIYLGVRIIFKLDPLGRTARSGLTGIAIVGFIMVLVSGIRLGLEFDRSSYYTNYQELDDNSSILYLNINEDQIYERFKETDFNLKWLQTPSGNLFTRVQLDIKKSQDGNLKMKSHIRSEGNTRRAARNNAENVNYTFSQVNDSVLTFDSYFSIGREFRYRAQEVNLTLYLPIGTRVFLNENMVDLIWDIKNLNDYWDYDMVNHEWIMTNKGLKCTDCPITDSYTEEEEETIDDFEESSDDIEGVEPIEDEVKEDIEDLELSQASIQKNHFSSRVFMLLSHENDYDRV